MISPILTYNSEAWGVFIKSDFKTWDTSLNVKGHLQFCKRFLQVNNTRDNKASNIACRAELCRYALIFDTIIKEFLSTLVIFKVRNKALFSNTMISDVH